MEKTIESFSLNTLIWQILFVLFWITMIYLLYRKFKKTKWCCSCPFRISVKMFLTAEANETKIMEIHQIVSHLSQLGYVSKLQKRLLLNQSTPWKKTSYYLPSWWHLNSALPLRSIKSEFQKSHQAQSTSASTPKRLNCIISIPRGLRFPAIQ